MHDAQNRAFRPIPNSVEISHREWTLDHRTDRAKQPLFIEVITASRDPDAPPEQSRIINYNRPQSRAWLVDHMAWALNTDRTVHLARSE